MCLYFLLLSHSCQIKYYLNQKEEGIAVARPYFFSSNHSFPGLEVSTHSGIEVPEEGVCLFGVLQKSQNPDHYRTFL